jgi:PBP1b-binding outer membrane lipoprotein LpoB
MKKTMKNLLSIILVALLLVSCKKEELNPVAKPEPGV